MSYKPRDPYDPTIDGSCADPAGLWVCAHCQEPIESSDAVFPYCNEPTTAMHRNCHTRLIIGSVAHVQKRCSCYVPGAEETDPPELTKRQAADLAVELMRKADPDPWPS